MTTMADISPIKSPQKRWIRNKLWEKFIKRRVKILSETYHGVVPRYLTFPGEFGLDIKRFVEEKHYFDWEHVFAFEQNPQVSEKLQRAYPRLSLRRERLEEQLVHRSSPDPNFFFDVINLDFTERVLTSTPDRFDRKLLAIEKIFWYQKRQQRSFSLFLTSNGNYDPNATTTHRVITRILEDHAKRLGHHEGYFRLAQQGLQKVYHIHLLDCLASVIIRIGYEAFFNTACQAKISYVPFNNPKRHPQMISLVFEAEWAEAALSQSHFHRYKRFESELDKSQLTALNVKINRIRSASG